MSLQKYANKTNFLISVVLYFAVSPHNAAQYHRDNHIECHSAEVVYNLYKGAGGYCGVYVNALEHKGYECAEPRCKEYYHKEAQWYRKGYYVHRTIQEKVIYIYH